MNMSDDLLGKINQLLEAKPRLSFNNDGCDVLDKGGNCVRSFKQKDLGEKYKKSAEVFLQQNYKTLNSEGFVWKESEDIKELTKKTLHSYVKKSREDSNDKTNDLHFDYHHTDGHHGDTADRFGGMHASGHDKLDQRNNGIQGAADRMADKKYGKAKPGKKTKLSKPLRSHPDDKPSTRYESQEVQEISKGVLNRYQEIRRNDHDVLGSRSAYHHQRAMDHGQGNYYSGTEKGKDKSDAHKEIAHYGPMSKDKAKKTFKKVVKHRDKESHNDNERHKMSTSIDKAFNRLASDKYGKAKPGQKTKLAKDVHEIVVHPETPMTNMERIAGFISAQTKVQSADGTSMMGVKKDIQELTKKTLGSYAKKAVNDRDNRIGVEAGDKHDEKEVDIYHYKDDRKGSDFKVKRDNTDPKLTKRTQGIKLAVKKMQSEDAETVSEISKPLAGNYLKKAMKSSDKQHSKMIAHGLNSSIANSMASGTGAPNKQEKKAAFKYADKEERKSDKAAVKYGKRQDGIKRALNTLSKDSKINKEHIDSISSALQEISKKTLGSYAKTAVQDRADRHGDKNYDYHYSGGNIGARSSEYHDGDDHKIDNRNDGIKKAMNRMSSKKYGKAKPGNPNKLSKDVKESSEIQEISKGLAQRYVKKALKSVDNHDDASQEHTADANVNTGGNQDDLHKKNIVKRVADDTGYSHKDAKKAVKSARKDMKQADYHDRKSSNRYKGMDRAINTLSKEETEMEEGMVDAVMSKLHPSRVERNAASRRQDAEASRKKAVKSAVASTVAKSLEKKQIKESNEVDVHEIEVHPETPMTNMERIAGFISAQTKVQSADGTSMMGVKKDIQEKKMSKAEFKDMMAGKDKGDMDGDGKQEPDDKEYMDNKDNAIKKSMGKKGKKDDMEEAIDQKSSDPEKTIGHNCATHVEHAEFGAGECIPGMHTLEETSEGEGIVTHYDVMFKNEDGHFVKEDVSVEDLTIVKEMHHGHKKKK